MIRILIAEDHQMVMAGLRALLEKVEGFEVVGEATNGQEAVTLAQKLNPHVLVMDIRMPLMNGIQAAARISELGLPVNIVILSMYSDENLIQQALKTGVRGYVLKSAAGDELMLAIQAAYRDETFLSSPVSSIVIQRALHPPENETSDDPFAHLSPREKEVFQLVAEGHTNNKIAEILFISEKTVEKHRAKLMEKLKVKSLAELVRIAIKYGLVDLDIS